MIMTDFYTAATERENRIIQDTRQQLENYRVEVKHSDGVYRHLECYNPERRWDCGFQVHTAPYTVTITGDWSYAYALRHMPDMLTEFLNTDEPQLGYWAEKVRNRAELKTVEYEFMLRYLFDWLEEQADEIMDAKTLERCKRELEKWIDTDEFFTVEYLNGWSFSYREKDTGCLVTGEPFYAFDYEDAEWDIWTAEWIRVCEMLRWTACKVTEIEATHGR